MAIGILADNRGLYNEADELFQHGAGNENLRNAINYFHLKTDEGANWGNGGKAVATRATLHW